MADHTIDLIFMFPPVFDFAMPHIAIPLLKAYASQHVGKSCRIIDLNQEFFREAIEASAARRDLARKACINHKAGRTC